MKRRTGNIAEPEDTLLPRITQWFFHRPQLTAAIWLVVVVFGILSYTTLLKREGFPSFNFPFSVINGAYFVNDPARVDKEVAKPLSELIQEREEVKTVQTRSFANFYVVTVQYKDGTDAQAITNELEKTAEQNNTLPEQATSDFSVPKFGFTARGDDLVVSVFHEDEATSTEQLVVQAEQVAKYLRDQNLQYADDISVINPFQEAIDPLTGQSAITQQLFDRFGERQNEKNHFHNSVAIGATRKPGADILKFNDEIEAAVAKFNSSEEIEDLTVKVSASYASSIRTQISELQKVLLEGLIAILIVGSIVIAFRASVITVISMVTVLSITLGVLYLLGYTLNTITLFALILSLSLIVDDTIIMVEALEAQRKRQRDAAVAVRTAARKVSRAMVAATLTAALSFAPLLFVGGILGGFIRAIPVTIITALLVSLLVALLFIPFFARFLLLGKNQMGEENVKEIGAAFEARIARGISAPMLWARGSIKKLMGVGIVALIIGFGFIAAGAFIGKYVTFNIFPEDKDSNQLSVVLAFPPQTSITDAENIADQADSIVGETISANFEQASYFATGDAQSATLSVNLIDYAKRDDKSPEIIAQLDAAFSDFSQAQVTIGQVSAGPPSSPFAVQINATDREAALTLANDIATYLKNDVELVRPDGTTVVIKRVTVANSDVYTREDGRPYIEVSAEFIDKDTTTLVTLTKAAIENEFTTGRLQEYGLDSSDLNYNFGQEEENQDSFKTLVMAFPILLAVIYLLLAVQFRSLLQPALIFMALPFSFFGISLGLYLTDNAFSFFAMLGFFALIGLSIKNTILLTDYANQSRKAGMGAVDAAHEALAERFRPLIATSLTAVVSLIPLALTSPFWEGLAVVLIFGLLSSTFLVITVFPYYYLGAEFLRQGVSRKVGLLWFVTTIVATVGLVAALGSTSLGAPAAGVVILGSFIGVVWYAARSYRKTAKRHIASPDVRPKKTTKKTK